MAVIVGMKPAELSDIKPFELPVQEMATGLTAVQKRADEVKNTIALGNSALAIETRPFDEDMQTAKQVQDQYTADVNKLLVEVNGDYSKIDNSQIQSLATKYATDDRVRYLTSAKKNFDTANSLAQKIRQENGTELFFGPVDPRKQGLYDENGNWLSFSDWDMQTQLGWVETAQSLFKDLGYELKQEYQFDENAFGMNWDDYYRKEIIVGEKWNTDRIQSIKDKAIQLYDATSAGKQYRRAQYNDIKKLNPSYTDQEINNIIDGRVQEMIFAIGDSREIVENKEQRVPTQLTSRGTPNSRGIKPGQKKKPSDEEKPITQNITTIDGGITMKGASLTGTTYADHISYLDNPNPIVDNLPELAKNPKTIKNKVVLENALLGVNPNIQPTETGDKVYFTGSIMSLDNTVGLTGDKNRSMFKVLNTRNPNRKSANNVNTYNKEETIMDLDDFASAYSEIYGVNTEIAKNNLLGTSTADGYMSMFDVDYNFKLKRHELKINPVITKVIDNLSKKTDELSKIKLNKINEKLKEAGAFQQNHKDDLEDYISLFDKADRNKEELVKINQLAMNVAGLDEDMIEQLSTSHQARGFSTPFLNDAQNIYTDSKLEITDDYIIRNLSNNKAELFGNIKVNGPNGSPRSVLTELGGGGDYVTLGKNSQPEYRINDANYKKGKERVSNDAVLEKAFNFYNDFVSDVLQKDLNLANIKTTIGNKQYQDILNKWGLGRTDKQESLEVFSAYATNKLNSLLPGDKYAKERKVLINAITDIGMSVNVRDPNQLQYKTKDSPEKINQIITQKTTDLIKEKAGKKGTNVPDEIITYFNILDNATKNYDETLVIYGSPSENTIGGKDLIGRMSDQIWKQVYNSKITRVRYNEKPEKGQKLLPEEYNQEDLKKSLDQRMRSEGFKGVIDDDKRKEFFINNNKGLIFDKDNEKTPFSVLFQITDYSKGEPKEIDVQIPVNPSPADLLSYGIVPLEAKYLNDAKNSLKENANSWLELKYENKSEFTTKAYLAQFDIPSAGIKKGEYFKMVEIGEPIVENALLPAPPKGRQEKRLQKPEKIGKGTLRDVIGNHLDNIYKGINMTGLQHIMNIENSIRNITDNKKKNEILVDVFGFENQPYEENYKVLQTMKDLVTKKEVPAQNQISKEQTSEEEILNEEEEDLGK